MAEHNILGSEGESLATQFLLAGGYTILERNFRISRIEVDIIAMRDGVVHFVEVKSRVGRLDSALLAFDGCRRERLILASELYISSMGLDCELSLDLVTVIFRGDSPAQISHYQGLQ
ncbi:MAG: YraN family protein [Rikenellaceae bacterium]